MTQEAKNFIKNYEGLRLKAYQCQAGKWTIGYGRTTNVKKGDTCTKEQAEKWFDMQYDSFKKNVNSYIKVPVTATQLGALTSFAYNCGLGALKTSTLLKKLNSGDYKGAADEFLRWNKVNGKESAGLTKRRKAERQMFLRDLNKKPQKKLPYKVKTKTALNIREKADLRSKVIRTTKTGEILTVWAITTTNGRTWGKNGNEWFCLDYCQEI